MGLAAGIPGLLQYKQVLTWDAHFSKSAYAWYSGRTPL
jgi:hypothetical protein